MKAYIYAKALKEVLEKTPAKKQKEVIARLKLVLKKRQDLRHLSQVIKEFERLWLERKGKRAKAIIAKPLGSLLRGAVSRALSKQGFQYEEEIKKEIVGGIALFLGNEYLVDNTIRSKLAKLHG